MVTHAHTTSSIGRILIGLAVLWGIIGLSGIESWAQDDMRTRATLRGVEGVLVMIEALKPEAERVGLTRQQLITDVEFHLRQAGIRVLTEYEWVRVSGLPWLYINVNVVLPFDGLTAYNVDVELQQQASLATDASLTTVSTWSVGSIGTVSSAHLIDTIRNSVKDQVDRFINAYLSVHPRPAGSAAPSSASPRRDLIRQVQERLQTVGFNPGTIDGALGPQTQQALRWFQNAQGLRATGDLDELTLNALGVR